jgi:hypothetical protein
VRRAGNAEFLHPVSKGAGVEAENLGGAARAGDDPVGLPENGEDVVVFDSFQAGLLALGRCREPSGTRLGPARLAGPTGIR